MSLLGPNPDLSASARMSPSVSCGHDAVSALGSNVPCVDGSELARAFFTFAALVGAAMCSAFRCGSHDRLSTLKLFVSFSLYSGQHIDYHLGASGPGLHRSRRRGQDRCAISLARHFCACAPSCLFAGARGASQPTATHHRTTLAVREGRPFSWRELQCEDLVLSESATSRARSRP